MRPQMSGSETSRHAGVTTTAGPARSRLRSFARGCAAALLFIGITFAFFFLVEGAASSALFVRTLVQEQEGVVITEEQHTQYDEELGWVSAPGISIPDMYGPGKGLTTNQRGFRGAGEVQPTVPPGKRRVICSGDSFTLGHGVGDPDTWCARLAALDPSLETVNMGQGGYGIDQAFLWYERDGADLERSVQILAFIGDDFFRVQNDHFLGYGKPFLRMSDGKLEVTNVPAPRRSRVTRWLIQNGRFFRELATVRLLSGAVSRLGSGQGEGDVSPEDRTWAVTAAIFDSLAVENARQGSSLLLVFLPTPWDYDTELYAGWRSRVRAYADSTRAPYADLVETLR
ncbi:MAG: hypothetical protein ABL963_13330, partial [Longimicrobiales bacterium]